MELICHRRNSIKSLNETSAKYGVEVDIRSNDGNLIINHDPLESGILFSNWLKHYHHGTLILNVKEEGLERALIDLMKLNNITNYFFLDQSFPFLIKWANLGESRSAIRVSEYESIETALCISGLVEWVWLDCFTKFPINFPEYKALKDSGYKICLVSPELQGRDNNSEILKILSFMKKNNIHMDAICTKKPNFWEDSTS
jgi:hypothetical protein